MPKTKIQGYVFDISSPYKAGHTISKVEADALNQLRAENIGNNMRETVKSVIATLREGEPLSGRQVFDLQGKVTEYDKSYTLAMTRGRVVRDPVEKMARTIARQYLEQELVATGMSLAEYREVKGKNYYNAKIAEIASLPEVIEQAKLRRPSIRL